MSSGASKFIDDLHEKDQQKLLHGPRAENLSALEMRLESNENIHAVLPGSVNGDLGGVLALTSRGARWSGKTEAFWEWGQMRSIAGGRYTASIILTSNNSRIDFSADAKRQSKKRFEAVVEKMRTKYTAY